MFGLGWASGDGRIVSLRLLAKSAGDIGQGLAVNEYMIDVRPDDGSPPFRGTAKDPINMTAWRQPSEGDVVRVKYHVKDRKVKFDHDDPQLHVGSPGQRFRQEVREAHTPEAERRWKELAAGAPTGHAEDDAQRRERVAAPGPAPSSATVAAIAESTSDILATLNAIKAAKAAGNHPEVNRLKAEFAERAAERGNPVGSGPLLATTPSGDDRLGRLERLAALHDRGVLTDAEFTAEKAKLLSEG